ncbi:MAG: hypothetical protein ACN6P8_06520 [Achromobacter piechaudii]
MRSRQAFLKAINPQPAPGFAGKWKNLTGEIEITQGADGQLMVAGNAPAVHRPLGLRPERSQHWSNAAQLGMCDMQVEIKHRCQPRAGLAFALIHASRGSTHRGSEIGMLAGMLDVE